MSEVMNSAIQPAMSEKAATAASKGVLFDFDGVLINSLPAMRLAFEAAYRDHYGDRAVGERDAGEVDFDALFAQYRLHLGKGFAEIMRALGLSIELLPHFKQHSRYLARYVRAYNGVEKMLSTFVDEGWVLGVATGKDYARTCELLEQLGLSAYFAVVLGCDSVACPKPAPDMVTAFMERTGVSHEHVIMVGDAPADLECARRACCKSVAALWGFTPAEVLRRENPTSVADSPAQLLAVCRAMSMEFQS